MRNKSVVFCTVQGVKSKERACGTTWQNEPGPREVADERPAVLLVAVRRKAEVWLPACLPSESARETPAVLEPTYTRPRGLLPHGAQRANAQDVPHSNVALQEAQDLLGERGGGGAGGLALLLSAGSDLLAKCNQGLELC